ncbi:hypothetical protein KCU65_g7715, partial [Aureobasidium melanogenum]
MFEAIPQSEPRRSTIQRSGRHSHSMDIANNAGSLRNDIERGSTPAESDGQLRQSKPTISFEPIKPPAGYTPLDFLPKLLTGWALWSLASFYAVLAVLLAYLFYRSRHDYYWTIHDVNYYLVARYLPTIIGVISSEFYSSTMSSLRRMMPFICMADQPSDRINDPGSRVVITVDMYRLPTWEFFLQNTGGILLGLLMAFKSVLLSVQENNDHTWVISVRAIPAIYLSISYLVIALITAYIAFKYANCRTGLKKDWDPTSLADIVLLFSTEDTKPKLDFPLKYRSWSKMMKESGTTYRLGYWKIHYLNTSSSSIVYVIRSFGHTIEPSEADTHLENFNTFFGLQGSLEPYFRQHVEQAYAKEPGPSSRARSATCDLLPTYCCAETPTCLHYPYRKAPGSVSRFWPTIVILYLMLLFMGTGYASIRIWTSQGIIFRFPVLLIQSNDIPLPINDTNYQLSSGNSWISVPPDTPLFSWGMFLLILLPLAIFRFLPVMIMAFASSMVSDLDSNYRLTQPYVNMYTEASSASQSLLLDYMTVSPLAVLPEAWANGHFKVIYLGVLNALSWIPILVTTGLCSIVLNLTNIVVVQVAPTLAFFGVVWSLLYIHALTYWWVPPERKLPRDNSRLYDIFCYVYDSKLRWHSEFGHAAFSPDLTKDELHSLIRLSRDKYLFGLVGEPGEEHPGFDIAETSDSADTGYVRWIKPNSGFFVRVKSRFQRRKSKTERSDDVSDPEGIPLTHLNASFSTFHRRRLSAEDPHLQGHSTALESESIQSVRMMANL